MLRDSAKSTLNRLQRIVDIFIFDTSSRVMQQKDVVKQMAEQVSEHPNALGELKSHLHELLCIFCGELVIKATVLSCSHTFCSQCVIKWMYCPTCRSRIITPTKCLSLDNYVNALCDFPGIGVVKTEKDTAVLEGTPFPLPVIMRHRLTGFPRESVLGRIDLNIDDVIDITDDN